MINHYKHKTIPNGSWINADNIKSIITKFNFLVTQKSLKMKPDDYHLLSVFFICQEKLLENVSNKVPLGRKN